MRRWFLALAAMVGLTLCGAAEAQVLTANGWGRLRIGMSERQAVRLFHMKIPRSDDGVSSFECRELDVPGHPGVSVMAERGIITRITVWDSGGPRTDRGLGIGATEADLRRAYGKGLEVHTAAYDEEPAHDLTFWTVRHRRGIQYGTDQQGRVTRIHAGGKSILYIEGCL
jgi:hypothetical protein